jgi:hypothetical protein
MGVDVLLVDDPIPCFRIEVQEPDRDWALREDRHNIGIAV